MRELLMLGDDHGGQPSCSNVVRRRNEEEEEGGERDRVLGLYVGVFLFFLQAYSSDKPVLCKHLSSVSFTSGITAYDLKLVKK